MRSRQLSFILEGCGKIVLQTGAANCILPRQRLLLSTGLFFQCLADGTGKSKVLHGPGFVAGRYPARCSVTNAASQLRPSRKAVVADRVNPHSGTVTVKYRTVLMCLPDQWCASSERIHKEKAVIDRPAVITPLKVSVARYILV